MLTMTQVHDIRKAYFEEGMTLSAIAAKHHVDRKTVRKYLDQENFNAPPPPAASRALRWPKLEPLQRSFFKSHLVVDMRAASALGWSQRRAG